MPSWLTRLTGGHCDAFIKISPQSDFVILSGAENEAAGQYIRGKVTLCLPSAQRAKGVQLQMVGYHRTSGHESKLHSASSTAAMIYKHAWEPFLIDDMPEISLGGPLPKGNYEWPFELLIPGDIPETARGCTRCSIMYHLKAHTIRDTPDTCPQAMKAIRVIRTLPSSAFELMDAVTIEGTREGKLDYSISVAHQAIALGTALPVDLCFTALAKGVTLKSIKCYLLETHGSESPGDPALPAFVGHRSAAEWDLLSDDRTKTQFSDEMAGLWRVARRLPLPTTLIKCSPDVDTHGIKVSHKVHFEVTFQDAYKMTTNFSATIPVNLYISPNAPVAGSDYFIWMRPNVGVCPSGGMNSSMEVPPSYGKHTGDELLEDDRPSFLQRYDFVAPAYTRCAGVGA
ncbi:hypothetical protein ACHAQA_004961 [Verticillium albo-atrum]